MASVHTTLFFFPLSFPFFPLSFVRRSPRAQLRLTLSPIYRYHGYKATIKFPLLALFFRSFKVLRTINRSLSRYPRGIIERKYSPRGVETCACIQGRLQFSSVYAFLSCLLFLPFSPPFFSLFFFFLSFFLHVTYLQANVLVLVQFHVLDPRSFSSLRACTCKRPNVSLFA